jgi:thiamine transport system ATP-binding protein
LLDEPLAALDRSLRERLLTDLRDVLTTTGTTAVFVTHDQHEAFAVADLLAVLRSGTILQVGRAEEIWSAPASEWVAGFVGYSSILDGAVVDRLGAAGPRPAGRIALRPTALVLDPTGSLTGRVLFATPAPDGLLLTVTIDGVGDLQAIGPAAAVRPAVGAPVRLRFDSAATALIPALVPATAKPEAATVLVP